jgi:energy-coupling factor transporter transmembrane protein EcfT
MGKKLDYFLYESKKFVGKIKEYFDLNINKPIEKGYSFSSTVHETITALSFFFGLITGPLICLIGSFIFGFDGIWILVLFKFAVTSLGLIAAIAVITFMLLELSLGYYVVHQNIKKAFKQFKENAEKHSNETEK